ncbi:diadenylate cyclase [Halorubrum sp. CSM-61]|uniref:diadenylate cyclase n=1 Tax=Halorubrum sp. CSM-61 TaxID=2485838 RepID=UPI001F14BB57
MVTADGTIHEQMVRLKDLPEEKRCFADGSRKITYGDWMGARHMSALETSLREEVVTTITLSGETGRVTRFHNGEYTTSPREELGAEWRGRN